MPLDATSDVEHKVSSNPECSEPQPCCHTFVCDIYKLHYLCNESPVGTKFQQFRVDNIHLQALKARKHY